MFLNRLGKGLGVENMNVAVLSLESANSTTVVAYVKKETVEGLRIGMLALVLLSVIGALFGSATAIASLVPIDLQFSKVAAIAGIICCVVSVPTLLYFAMRKPLPVFLGVSAASMGLLGIIVGMIGL
jgi:hypothetical protein